MLAEQAGLTLNDMQFDLLLRTAPWAFEMRARMRSHARASEPANTFRFDSATLPGDHR
jgi:hypothetical protein